MSRLTVYPGILFELHARYHVSLTLSKVTFTTQYEYQQVSTKSKLPTFWVGANVTNGASRWAAGPEGALYSTLTAESNQLISDRGLWNPLNHVDVSIDGCVVDDVGTWSSVPCLQLAPFIIEYERCKSASSRRYDLHCAVSKTYGPFYYGGNLYELVSASGDWSTAMTSSQTYTYRNMFGHLVSCDNILMPSLIGEGDD